MSFRLLEYCVRIWADVLRADRTRPHFAEAVREWPWTPRFTHVLLDQSQAAESEVRGGVAGCAAQLALMAAARRHPLPALLLLVRYLVELARRGRFDLIEVTVTYIIETQDEEIAEQFGAELQRQLPGPGGDMTTYAEVLLQRGRQEGRQEGREEGRQEGQLGAIEGFLRAGVRWSVIKAATGIDEAAFRALRQQRQESDRKTG